MANEWQPNISKKIFIIGGDDVQSNTLATYLAENAAEVQYTPFDLSSLQLGAGAHTIKVKAKASGYQDSEFSNSITYPIYVQLDTPVCSLSGDTLSWSAISNAASYTLYVDNAVSQTGITALTFDLSTLTSLSATAHTVQLKAIGTGYYTDSSLSNSVSYTPMEQLSTPSNVSISGTDVSFDEVENAESYEFFANGTSIGTYEVPQGYNVTINYNAQSNYGGNLMLSINGEAFVTYTSNQTLSFTNVETIEWKTDTNEFVYFDNCTGDFVSGKHVDNTLTLTQDSSATVHTED